jgi:hypothetical protein
MLLAEMLSKKLENLRHAIALHFIHWNFRQIHQLLRITAAMITGVSGHVTFGRRTKSRPLRIRIQTDALPMVESIRPYG